MNAALKIGILISFLILSALACRENTPKIIVEEGNAIEVDLPYPKFLSEYNLFHEPLSEMKPKDGVLLYEINSPLFSDYSFKKRFIYLPAGTSMKYNDKEVFDFPEGSLIFKFFYYPEDFSEPNADLKIIETRILIKEKSTWVALPYIWNEEQTDAKLQIAGGNKQVDWISAEGKKKSVLYSIPNMNDCKSCHDFNGELTPIGPSARQMNKNILVNQLSVNQLEYFHDLGALGELPSIQEIPSLTNWEDDSQNLNLRARAYLEINCAHCHRREGPAKTSALHLLAHEASDAQIGIGKTPIAAGRGSGGLKYDIVPGEPENSILYYRMVSTEPGIMMPELGRKLAHEEGLELIRNWIKNLK